MPLLPEPRTGTPGSQDDEKVFCVDHKGVGDISSRVKMLVAPIDQPRGRR